MNFRPESCSAWKYDSGVIQISVWSGKNSLSPISELIFSSTRVWTRACSPHSYLHADFLLSGFVWLSQHDRWHDPNAKHAARATACWIVEWIKRLVFQKCFLIAADVDHWEEFFVVVVLILHLHICRYLKNIVFLALHNPHCAKSNVYDGMQRH